MQLFLEYVKQRRTEIILFFLFFIIFFISFLLYKLPISAVIYPLCLCVFFGVVILPGNVYNKATEGRNCQ